MNEPTAQSESVESFSTDQWRSKLFALLRDPANPSRTMEGGLISQRRDQWITSYWQGPACSDAARLASEAIDQGRPARSGEWTAIAVPSVQGAFDASRSSGQESKVIHRIDSGTPMPGLASQALIFRCDFSDSTGMQIASLWAQLSCLHQRQLTDSRRLAQITKILREAAVWQRTDDDHELLKLIAECSCDVLNCERATIFLLDKRRRKLIGRPAIGVSGGVLEVDSDQGIVGEVVRSESPQWWSAGGNDENRVNRRVDKSQNFHTRSLLAVPMLDARGQVLGVFEAINAIADEHRGDTFGDADVWTMTELARHAATAIEAQTSRTNLTRSRDRLVEQAASASMLIGSHPSIREVRKNAEKVAPTDLSVLILGRNGTGKEVLASHIHYHSRRRTGPFIAVNCAALVETLLESELFGHEKGAFTDASAIRVGKFELASGGTLFLDEVGDLSPGGQAKLLRVLEDKIVVRVGGSQPIPVDVRVIAATNQPLQELIAARRFREDLFFRLNVVSLTLPPLAARGNDVIELVEFFMEHFCRQIGRPVPRLDESAVRAMLTHPWPGNVRELRNTIERLCYLTTGEEISANQLMLQSLGSGSGASSSFIETRNSSPSLPPVLDDCDLSEVTRLFQVAHIEATIAACRGNMTESAARLGLHRSNLYRKMRQLGMPTSGQ